MNGYLLNLAAGAAYWMNVSWDATLTLDGEPHAPPRVSLAQGWQAAAYPGTVRSPTSVVFDQHPELLAAWRFDNEFKRFAHFQRAAPAAINTLFGVERHRVSTDPDGYRSDYTFSDNEQDPENGLAYFGARYYDPFLAVFISVDPVAGHTAQPFLESIRLNAYAYAGNNPLVLVAPDGRVFFAAIAIGAAIGATLAAVQGGDFGDILKGAFWGGVSGAIGGGFGQLGVAAAGVAGSGAAATVVGAASGAAGSYLTGGVDSTLRTGRWSHGNPLSIIIGAVSGAYAGFAEYSKAARAASNIGPQLPGTP